MKRPIAAALAAAALLPAAHAEPPVVVLEPLHLAAAPEAQADAWRRWADDFSRQMRASMGTLFAGRMGPGKVVKGAPYSAEVVTEANQALADGNVITRRKTGAVHRDGEGRTRQETATDGKARSIFINDPVEGKHYVLLPGAKRAIATPSAPERAPVAVRHRNRQVVRMDGTEVRVEDGKVFIDGVEVAGRVERSTSGGKTIVVENGRVTVDGRDVGAAVPGGRHVVINTVQSGDGLQHEEVRVQVIRSGDHPAPPATPPGLAPQPPVPPTPPLPPLPGVDTMRFDTAGLGKGVTTKLGTKDFDGVKAEGESTVWTIPAGQIGNRNPIQVTSETWFSPELQVTVYSRHSDPRSGESIYRLASIKRGEPPADLFRVPADFEVKGRAGRR